MTVVVRVAMVQVVVVVRVAVIVATATVRVPMPSTTAVAVSVRSTVLEGVDADQIDQESQHRDYKQPLMLDLKERRCG